MWAWNVDGIMIPDVCTYDAYEQAIVGTVHQLKGSRTEVYKWWAKAGPHGYTVIIEDYRRLQQTYVGTTFNVFCEVAGAVRRLG